MKNKYFLFGGMLIIMYLMSRKKYIPPKIVNLVDSLAKHHTKVYSNRDLSEIKQIVLHHYASDGTPQAIANYHVNSRDWAGIGYHYTINKDGTISQVNNLNTISYHTSGQNTKSIGVALEGNFEHEQPTVKQMDSLNKLIPYLRSILPQSIEVFQHSDFANKPFDASLNLTPYKLSSLSGVVDLSEVEDIDNYQRCNNDRYTNSFQGGACSKNGGLFSPADYVTQSDVEQYFFKDFIIAEFLLSHKIKISSFLEYSNKDNVKTSLHFLSKNGIPLDDAAQQLQMRHSTDFEPQEIVNFIENYSSPQAAIKDLKEQTFEYMNYQQNVGDLNTTEFIGNLSR